MPKKIYSVPEQKDMSAIIAAEINANADIKEISAIKPPISGQSSAGDIPPVGVNKENQFPDFVMKFAQVAKGNPIAWRFDGPRSVVVVFEDGRKLYFDSQAKDRKK